MQRGNELLTFLHGDHLNSTVLATRGGASSGQERYYAYGKDRLATPSVPTDNRFTGQKEDASGLVYMNARYYDPVTGHFVSPDTLVPDATNLFDYNRYMYVRGNPLKYTDPTGHFSEEQLNWLGIYEDKVSESVWELLLKLEPFDRVNVREDRIGQVVFGANLREGDAQIYLEFLVGGERRGAVEWLTANEGLLSGASIRRLVGSEYKEVWRDGTLVAPEYEHSLGQAGFITGPQGAAANRFFNGLGGVNLHT